MQDTLKIALIQSGLVWENPELNRENFTHKINNIQEDIDVIILPEMFTTGFTMNASNVSELMSGETVKWMQHIASSKDSLLIGSVIISEYKTYYNRLLVAYPSGEIKTYDKRHTFTLAGEDKVYSKGTKKLIIEYKGWSISPLVCYDLRFPVWARNVEDYDVLIYVANWPEPRIKAWDALLKARAIENMCYCIGVNRVGEDEKGHQYSGNSAVYDVLGEKISNITKFKEEIEVVTLQKSHIHTLRKKLQFLNDKDDFIVSIE